MSKKIVCNYDPQHGHIKLQKNKQKDTTPYRCEHQNICQLNPTPSRYKETVTKQEESQPIQQKYQCQTIVRCTQKKCKNYNTDNCKHGKPHQFTSECLILCERYHGQLCEPMDKISANLCVNGLVSEYNICKKCEYNIIGGV